MGSWYRTLGANWVSEQLLFVYMIVLLGPSFYVMFHTSYRDCKLKENHFGNLGKNCGMSNNCKAFLKLDMMVLSNCNFKLVSSHALTAREGRTQFFQLVWFFNNHVNYMKRGTYVVYIFCSIVRKIHNYLTFFDYIISTSLSFW